MSADFFAESLAFMAIADARFQARHDLSNSSGGHRKAPVIKGRHSYLKPFAFLPQQIFCRNFHILKKQFTRIARPDAMFSFNGLGRKTLPGSFYYESGNRS